MKKYFFSLLLLCLLACNSCNKKGKVNEQDYTKTLNDFMQGQVEFNNFSGTVLVMRNDSQLLKKAYGLADREWNTPNTIETKFHIASITKWFTAAAILKLEEMKKLSTDDKLSKYFPDYPKGNDVTIHMLLTHTSGIADCFHLDSIHNARFSRYTLKEGSHGGLHFTFDKDSILSILKSSAYDFTPETDVSYSNSGYLLLGLIIEKVSGKSYDRFVQDYILKPAGMFNSGVSRYDSILMYKAKGYQERENGFVNAFNEDFRVDQLFSAGSMYTTVDDLYKWDRILYGTKLLNETSKNKMFMPLVYKQGEDTYGYGCVIDSLSGHKRISMRGWVMGFKSVIYRFTEDNTCIIILSNNELRPAGIANCLFSIINNQPVENPYKHIAQKNATDHLTKYVGTYKYKFKDSFISTIEIIAKKNTLYRVAPAGGSDTTELIAESPKKFFYGDGSDRQIKFNMNTQGKTLSLNMVSSGFIYEMIKVK
jgi:CubicO group peptidase (beta-lactamase class C family)